MSDSSYDSIEGNTEQLTGNEPTPEPDVEIHPFEDSEKPPEVMLSTQTTRRRLSLVLVVEESDQEQPEQECAEGGSDQLSGEWTPPCSSRRRPSLILDIPQEQPEEYADDEIHSSNELEELSDEWLPPCTTRRRPSLVLEIAPEQPEECADGKTESLDDLEDLSDEWIPRYSTQRRPSLVLEVAQGELEECTDDDYLPPDAFEELPSILVPPLNTTRRLSLILLMEETEQEQAERLADDGKPYSKTLNDLDELDEINHEKTPHPATQTDNGPEKHKVYYDVDSDSDPLLNVNLDVSSKSGFEEDNDQLLGAVGGVPPAHGPPNILPILQDYHMEDCFSDPVEAIPPAIPPSNMFVVAIEPVDGEGEEEEPPEPDFLKRKHGSK